MRPTVSLSKTAPGESPHLDSHESSVILDYHSLLNSPTAHSFNSLHSGAGGWPKLCEQVSEAQDYKDIAWSDVKIKDEARNVALVLLAAIHVNNQELVAQLEGRAELKAYREEGSGKINIQRLTLACLKECVLSGQEDLACGCVQLWKEKLPLYLVHRAGEQGMLRFLYSLYSLEIPIQTNRVIATMPYRVRIILKRNEETQFQRFPAKQGFVTLADLVHWAVLARSYRLILDLIKESPSLLQTDLIEALLAEKLGDLLGEALNVADIDTIPLLQILNYGEIGLAVRLVDESQRCLSSKTPKVLRPYKVILKLISMVSNPDTSISALYLLSLIAKYEWNEPEVDCLLETLQKVLIEEDIEDNTVVNCGNALLYCVAVSELCVKVAQYSLHHQDDFTRLSVDFLSLAEEIQAKYTDYRKLKVLYMERAYGSLCLFDVITQKTDRYRGLLKSDIVAAIVQDLWTGGTSEGLNFSYISAVNQYFDGWSGGLFSLHTQYLNTPLPKSLFQLYYWKKNGSLRLLVETAMLLCLCGILISQVVLYVQLMKVIEDPNFFLTNSDPNAYLSSKLSVQMILTRFIVANAGALVLNIIQILTYKILLKEQYLISFTDVLSVILFLSSLAANILSDPSVSSIMDPADSTNTQEGVYAVLVFTICLRMSAILTLTRTFGPWIRMIFIITKDIVVFLLLYLLAVLAFTLTYVILFRREADYFGSVQLGVRTLFQWSVAGVDTTIFTEREELGSILAIAWAFVSSVIILNLLIAVLSSRYEALSPLVTADYVSLMYQSYRQTHYEAPFGALVIAPAPFNLLTIVLVPMYLTWPGTSQYLDPIFVVLSYQIWFLIGSVLFAIYCIKSSILAYIYVILQFFRAKKAKRRCEILLWVLFGPFYLAALSLLSYFRFAKAMYQSQSEEVTSIPPEVLAPSARFLNILDRYSKDKICWISLKEVESTLARFPRSKNSFLVSTNPSETVLFVKRNNPFKEAADRIYFSRAQLIDERSKSIIRFFQQFESYCAKGEMPRVNVHRMKRLIAKYSKTPDKLVALNISAVQGALLNMR